MAENGQNTMSPAEVGKMSLDELRATFAGAENANLVTVQDWGAIYSSITGQLSEFCTVVANSGSDNITGIGLIAYNSNGTTLYCVQYSNGFDALTVETSIGTGMYNPADGDTILAVIYGWTGKGSFYFSKQLQIQSE